MRAGILGHEGLHLPQEWDRASGLLVRRILLFPGSTCRPSPRDGGMAKIAVAPLIAAGKTAEIGDMATTIVGDMHEQ